MRKFIEQDSYTTQQIFTVDESGLLVEKSLTVHIFQKKATVLRLWKIAWYFFLGPTHCKISFLQKDNTSVFNASAITVFSKIN